MKHTFCRAFSPSILSFFPLLLLEASEEMKKTTWVFPIERLYLVRCILIKLVAFSIQFIIQSREVRSFARETESIRWPPNLGILNAGATNSTHCFYTKETAKLSIKRQEKDIKPHFSHISFYLLLRKGNLECIIGRRNTSRYSDIVSACSTRITDVSS